MANTVESTIKVNVEANTQGAENNINKVSTEFKELQGITEDINKSNNKLFSNEEISTEINKVNELVSKYKQLSEAIQGYKFSSTDKMVASMPLVHNLDDKAENININNYKQRVKELEQVQKKFNEIQSAKKINDFSNSGITENSVSRLKEYKDGLSGITRELINISKSSTISNTDKLSKLDEYKTKLENIRTGLINLRNENNKNGLDNTNVEKSLSKLTQLDNIIYNIKDKINNISNSGSSSSGLFDKFLDTNAGSKIQSVFKDINNEMFNGSTKSLGDLIGGTRVGKELTSITSKIKGLPGYIQAIAIALTPVIITSKYILKQFGEIFDKIVDISTNVVKAFPSTVVNVFTDSINTAISALGFIKDQIVETVSKMKELSEEAKSTQQSFFTLYNYLGSVSGSKVVDFNKMLSFDKGVNLDEITASMKGLQGSLSNMNLDTKGIQEYNEAFEGLMLDLSKFDGSSLEEVSGQLESAISFGVLNSRSALAKSMDLTAEQIEQFKQLNTVEERAQWILGHWQSVAGTYDRWLDTNAGKVQTLQNSWANFMSQIQQLALSIYAVFAPVLTHLINMFTLLGEHINEVFGTSIETARANNAKNILKQSSAIDKLTKSTDKNTKANLKNRNKNNLASFDDIISLSKDTSNKDDTKSQAKNLINLSKLLEDYGIKTKKARTEWDKYRDSIEKALNNKNYEKAGLLLSKYFDSLMKFDWTSIKSKFKDGAEAVARFLNGIFGNEKSFKDFGSNIAEVLNTIAITIDAFFTNFDFGKAGTSLAQSFNAFVSNIDTAKAAETLANVFNGIINLASSYIMSLDRSKAVKKISEFIYTFFTNFTSEDADKASKAVLKAIGDVLTIVGTTIYDTVSNAEFGNIVGTIFENITTWVADNGGQIGKNISDIILKVIDIFNTQILSQDNIDNIIKGVEGFVDGLLSNEDAIIEKLGLIIDKIVAMLEKWRTDGTLQKITDFIIRIFTETNLPDLIFEILSYQSEIKGAVFIGKAITFIKGFGGTILKVIGGIILAILVALNPAIILGIIVVTLAKLIAKSKWFHKNIVPIFKAIGKFFKGLGEKAKELGKAILDFIKGLVKKAKGVAKGIKEGVEALFKKIKEVIEGFVKKAKGVAKGIKEGVKGLFKSLKGFVKGFVDKLGEYYEKIKKFVGGIAKKIKSIGGGIGKKIKGGASSLVDNITSNIPIFNIQAHATGGITNGPSIGLIGEQGKEAVLPLERGNTLQTLGNAILNSATVNKTQQSRSSNLNINISGFNKEFYTKAEVKNIANGIADILVQGGYSLT